MSAPKLFQPIKIGNITLKHHVVLAPMTRDKVTPSEAPVPGLVKEYHAQRASTPGTLEGTVIAPKAHGIPGLPGFWTDEQINGWKEVVDELHAKGSFISLQIMALGRDASRVILQARDPSLGAGDIPYTGGDQPRPLTQKEIQECIDLFAQAAKSAVEKAGFDGVEVHGCNSDLVEQFLEDVSNHRMDEYGGNIENRARLVYWRSLGRSANEFIQKIWSPRPLVLSGGYTRQTAIEKVETAENVLIAFGRHFLANHSLYQWG